MPTPSSSTGEPPPRCTIERFTLGMFATNCYLVYEPPVTAGAPCWIIDASFEPQEMIDRTHELRLTPAALILTHAHVDHIAGVNEVLAAFPGTPLLIHPAESDWLTDPAKNLSILSGIPVTARPATGPLADGQQLALGRSRWIVLHTPGHSPGGITLYNQRDAAAIVGDALFAGSVGRTDFPGSDPRTLAASIRTKLYRLPPDTVIHPGHGPDTTIGREANSNPFVRAS
jgi:hydroxyacylglutathione hydrolase